MNCSDAALFPVSQFQWDLSDEYIAAAVHELVDAETRGRIDDMLFRVRRTRIRWANAVFAPPSILSTLASFDEYQLNIRVVRNGRTPLEALRRIRRVETDERILGAIAAHRNASPQLLATFSNSLSSVVRFSLAGNAATPADILNIIAANASKDERRALAGNPGASGELLEFLWRNANDDEHLRAEIAAHPQCPAELLAAALTSDCDVVRRKLAGNPAVTHEQLVALLDDPIAAVRAEAIRHAPTNSIAIDGNDPAASVRKQTARRHGLPERLVAKLANDECSSVRRWLARNPGLSIDVLAQLANDASTEVRRSVARNVNCPQSLLRQLATDKNPWVRAGVSFRSDLGADVLCLFAHEDDIDVLSGIGKNPRTPLQWLKRIAASDNADLRRAVILNPKTPAALLGELAEDAYAFNRITLVERPTLPTAILRELLADPEPQVRFTAATRLARITMGQASWQSFSRSNAFDDAFNLSRGFNAKENSDENTRAN